MFCSWSFVVPEVAGPDDERSIPVQNHFPVFVRMMVCNPGSDDKEVIVSRRDCTIDAFKTFPLVGLFNVNVAVEGVREISRRSDDGDGICCDFIEGVRFV